MCWMFELVDSVSLIGLLLLLCGIVCGVLLVFI